MAVVVWWTKQDSGVTSATPPQEEWIKIVSEEIGPSGKGDYDVTIRYVTAFEEAMKWPDLEEGNAKEVPAETAVG